MGNREKFRGTEEEAFNQEVLGRLSELSLPLVRIGKLELGLPVGRVLLEMSELNRDLKTREWVRGLNCSLSQGCVAMVYRHVNLVDHLAIGAALIKELSSLEQVYVPVGASWMGKPWIKSNIFDPLNEVRGMELMATVRKTDEERGVSPDNRGNRNYLRELMGVFRQNRVGTVLLFPPGGGRIKIDNGFVMQKNIARLLSEAPVLTYVRAEFRPRRGKFEAMPTTGRIWNQSTNQFGKNELVEIYSEWVKFEEGVWLGGVGK